jgi:sugar-specific transcriptional regulator TrmB
MNVADREIDEIIAKQEKQLKEELEELLEYRDTLQSRLCSKQLYYYWTRWFTS